MLYRNRICMLMSQNFKLMQSQYMQSNLQGDNISVLMPLSQMFEQNPDMMYQFASEAYKVMFSSGFCKETDFTDCYEQLANYGVFFSNFVFAYNCKTGKMALYTSSYSILVQLASRGILMGKKKPIAEEMRALEEVLVSGNRIASSIRKGGLIQAVRLDWEYKDNKLIFRPTVPRSQISLRDEYIIPYTALDCAMRFINDELQTKVLRITSGDKVRVVTKNQSILSMIYGEVRANSLLSYGFDARSNSFYVPHVGASIFSSGVTNIDLTAVDKIQVVNSLAEIDLSEVKVDVSTAPDYCAVRLGNLSDEQLIDLGNRLDIQGISNDRTSNEAIISSALYVVHPYKLYNVMKESGYFDIADFKKQPPKWGDCEKAHQVDIPSTVPELQELLKKGIFKITLHTRNGSYSPVVVTNSFKELRRIYGEDFYAKFESYGNRLRQVGKELEKKFKDGIYESALYTLCDKWSTLGFYETVADKYDISDDEPLDYDTVRKELLVALHNVDERKTVIKQPSIVTARSCDCNKDVDSTWGYYKNIDLRSIKSIVQLTSVE